MIRGIPPSGCPLSGGGFSGRIGKDTGEKAISPPNPEGLTRVTMLLQDPVDCRLQRLDDEPLLCRTAGQGDSQTQPSIEGVGHAKGNRVVVVVLIDVDGKDPDQELHPFKTDLPGRLSNGPPHSIQFAYAQWHLEAWYFADAEGLRDYLSGQAPGHVDTSRPDDIQNPKNHLRNLLGNRLYTSLVSEEIAKSLNPQVIAQRSPSFRGFLEAVRNGSANPSQK